MGKHHLLITLLLTCGLIGSGVAAQAQQEKNQNDGVKGPSATLAEPKGEQTGTKESTQMQTKKHVQADDPSQEQEQDRKREQQHRNDDAPCFTAEDGNTYRWQYRFSRKLQRLEEQGNQEAMNNYLEKIANRYNFEYNNGAEDFVHWAIQNRPWDTE
jgi:hypothetical protein